VGGVRVTARDGLPLHTVDLGAGAPALLAQGGWIGTWELWQPVFELLPTWRTVGFDHRGAGETPVDPVSITRTTLVSDLFDVMTDRGLDRCVLAGESQGALVALLAVLEQPQRFAGLVLVGGMTRYQVTDSTRQFGAALRADYDAALRGFAELCAPDDPDGYFTRWGLDILRRADPAAALRLLEVLDGVDVTQRLSELRLPVLVVHGSRDAVAPLGDMQEAARRIPGAELVVVAGAGHVPSFTHPVAVADALRRHFSPGEPRHGEPPTGAGDSSGP
jgi:3-oxoadipate enol-lactonase